MKILLLGATGLVGGEVLRMALSDQRVEYVITPVRRALNIEHQKLSAPVVDFDHLPEDIDTWQFDAIICALGTTMKQAKTKAAFKKIDYDYPLKFAKLGQRKNIKSYALNSALGANADSFVFYNKVKGELEQSLIALNFPSLTLVRPGLIEGDRAESRLAESLAIKATHVFKAILPKKLQLNPAENIAAALLEGVVRSHQGTHIISAQDLIAK